MAAVTSTQTTVDRSPIKAAVRECDRKLERYRHALEAGTEPTIVAGWVKEVTRERATGEAQLHEAQLKATKAVTPAELRAELESIGGLVPLLEESDPELKTKFYEEVGLEGTYDPKERVFEARVLNGCVGRGLLHLRHATSSSIWQCEQQTLLRLRWNRCPPVRVAPIAAGRSAVAGGSRLPPRPSRQRGRDQAGWAATLPGNKLGSDALAE
ncbi:MAG: hypothetical protein ACRDYY_06315 [Acidimicrobiales bacterium]